MVLGPRAGSEQLWIESSRLTPCLYFAQHALWAAAILYRAKERTFRPWFPLVDEIQDGVKRYFSSSESMTSRHSMC
jgi:hypothetical protein